MLDDFLALGRLDFFESALAFMAGYGSKSFLIAQSLNQIKKVYGPNNSILDTLMSGTRRRSRIVRQAWSRRRKLRCRSICIDHFKPTQRTDRMAVHTYSSRPSGQPAAKRLPSEAY